MRGRLLGFTSVPRQVRATAQPVTQRRHGRSCSKPRSCRWRRSRDGDAAVGAADFAEHAGGVGGQLPERPDIRVRIEAAHTAAGRCRSSSSDRGPWPTRMQALQRPLSDRIAHARVLLDAVHRDSDRRPPARAPQRPHRPGRPARRDARRRSSSSAPRSWRGSPATITPRSPDQKRSRSAPSQRIRCSSASCCGSSTPRWNRHGRRFWPDMLLGWSRLLAGRVRDSRGRPRRAARRSSFWRDVVRPRPRPAL